MVRKSAERCHHAYRKPGKNAVFCRAIPDNENDYCITQVMCRNTGRYEAAECQTCDWKREPAAEK